MSASCQPRERPCWLAVRPSVRLAARLTSLLQTPSESQSHQCGGSSAGCLFLPPLPLCVFYSGTRCLSAKQESAHHFSHSSAQNVSLSSGKAFATLLQLAAALSKSCSYWPVWKPAARVPLPVGAGEMEQRAGGCG